MQKRFFIGLIAILLFFSITIIHNFFVTAQQNQAVQISYTPFSETSCSNNICTATLYSYEKYFYNSEGNWVEIDENWHSCAEGYCTNEYHYKATANNNGQIIATLNNNAINFQLSNLLNSPLTFNPTINNNQLTYENIIPNVDLNYYYLPRELKEEIVINQPISNLPQNDFSITFTKSGNAQFNIPQSTICDANNNCQNIQHSITDNQISVTIPTTFLNNPNIVYPVIIDPSLTLNFSHIAWDGYVESHPTNGYTRTNEPKSLPMQVGRNGLTKWRGSTHWNISSIPDNADVIELNLSFEVKNVTCTTCIQDIVMNTKHMEGNEIVYPDNQTGNANFFADMGNGSVYNSHTFIHGFSGNINLSMSNQGKTDFENSLVSNDFSFGYQSDDQSGITIEIHAKSDVSSGKRPKLIVVYGANETDANTAIEQGINNSLPNNPIQTIQQIYLVNQTGGHFLGTFDKTTITNNQTWAFNYVPGGESFINIHSLFNILNVWENQSLTFSEIVSQVQNFINNTIIS